MTSHSECKLASVVTSKCPLCGDTELPITCCVNMQGKKSLKFVVCRSMNLMSCKQLIKRWSYDTRVFQIQFYVIFFGSMLQGFSDNYIYYKKFWRIRCFRSLLTTIIHLWSLFEHKSRYKMNRRYQCPHFVESAVVILHFNWNYSSSKYISSKSDAQQIFEKHCLSYVTSGEQHPWSVTSEE